MSLSLTPLDLIICCIAVIASVATGLVIAIRKGASETSSQFFLAGRRLGWPLVGASLFATNIGAEHLVGLSGDSYRYGLSAGAVELTTCICLGVACALLFPYYIRARVYTIPEFLELRYNRTARVFFSGLMLDVFQSPVLGEHAFALTFITFVAVHEHQKIRSKPAFQQSLIVFAVLLAYEVILFFIDGWTHHPITDPRRWVHTVTGAILWAPVAALLNLTNDRRR